MITDTTGAIARGRRGARGAALAVASVLGLLASPAARAHHSFAMFDQTRKVAIEGVVAEVQWVNPHVWVDVDVPDADGSTRRWGVEFTSRVHLTRQGFAEDTVSPGDHVTFELSPYRDGRPGGRFWTVSNHETGAVFRDPAAQRQYEIALRENGQAPGAPSEEADDRPLFYVYEGDVGNSPDARYADLDALPDWRGIWQPAFGQVSGGEPQLKEPYKSAYEEALARTAADPGYEIPERISNCEAPGMPYMMVMPYSLEFLFTPGKITVSQEAQMQVRRIYTDGRPLPEDPDPTYFGYSVGRWEGETLVVETVGTRPGQRLGIRGITNGPNLKIIEHIYLDAENPDVLRLDFTYEDPDVLEAPWLQSHTFRRNRAWDQIEYLCDGNDRHPIREDGSTDVVLSEG
jgi:hypothetical protein